MPRWNFIQVAAAATAVVVCIDALEQPKTEHDETID